MILDGSQVRGLRMIMAREVLVVILGPVWEPIFEQFLQRTAFLAVVHLVIAEVQQLKVNHLQYPNIGLGNPNVLQLSLVNKLSLSSNLTEMQLPIFSQCYLAACLPRPNRFAIQEYFLSSFAHARSCACTPLPFSSKLRCKHSKLLCTLPRMAPTMVRLLRARHVAELASALARRRAKALGEKAVLRAAGVSAHPIAQVTL